VLHKGPGDRTGGPHYLLDRVGPKKRCCDRPHEGKSRTFEEERGRGRVGVFDVSQGGGGTWNSKGGEQRYIGASRAKYHGITPVAVVGINL